LKYTVSGFPLINRKIINQFWLCPHDEFFILTFENWKTAYLQNFHVWKGCICRTSGLKHQHVQFRFVPHWIFESIDNSLAILVEQCWKRKRQFCLSNFLGFFCDRLSKWRRFQIFVYLSNKSTQKLASYSLLISK